MNAVVQLSPFGSLWNASPWYGTTHIQGAPTHSSTGPEVGFHGDSKSSEIDKKDELSYLSRVPHKGPHFNLSNNAVSKYSDILFHNVVGTWMSHMNRVGGIHYESHFHQKAVLGRAPAHDLGWWLESRLLNIKCEGVEMNGGLGREARLGSALFKGNGGH